MDLSEFSHMFKSGFLIRFLTSSPQVLIYKRLSLLFSSSILLGDKICQKVDCICFPVEVGISLEVELGSACALLLHIILEMKPCLGIQITFLKAL